MQNEAGCKGLPTNATEILLELKMLSIVICAHYPRPSPEMPATLQHDHHRPGCKIPFELT